METKKRDLTQGDLKGHMKALALPAGLGLLIHTMYNVVDTWFAGRISTDALAALSATFPLFFIIISASYGMGSGASALIANEIGAGNEHRAKHLSAQTFLVGIVLSVVVSLAGLWILEPALIELGLQEEVLVLGIAYMQIVFAGSFAFIFSDLLNAPLMASGDMKTLFYVTLFAFLVNLLLNPAFMFGWGPLPEMGFKGIAYSTITCECMAALYFGYRAVKEGLLDFKIGSDFIPRWRSQLLIIKHGVPAALNLAGTGVGIYIILWFLSGFGKEVVAAYGIAMRVEQIVILPVIGLELAALSMVGQNYGAGLHGRAYDSFKLCIKYGLYVAVAASLLMLCFGKIMLGLFSSDVAVLAHAWDYLCIAILLSFAYPLLFITVYSMQGLKRPYYVLAIGLLRQVILPISVFYLLTRILDWGIWGVWWGLFFFTAASAIGSWIYVNRVFKKL